MLQIAEHEHATEFFWVSLGIRGIQQQVQVHRHPGPLSFTQLQKKSKFAAEIGGGVALILIPSLCRPADLHATICLQLSLGLSAKGNPCKDISRFEVQLEYAKDAYLGTRPWGAKGEDLQFRHSHRASIFHEGGRGCLLP